MREYMIIESYDHDEGQGRSPTRIVGKVRAAIYDGVRNASSSG